MTEEVIWFARGVFYGIVVATTMGLWAWIENSEWLKHDNRVEPPGADIYLMKRGSTPRIFFICIASIVWPLMLVFIALRWITSIPIVIYRKTDR
jgi:hypothetical protein